MELRKDFNKDRGIAMVKDLLSSYKDELPEGKTVKDFSGGYVEFLKTKANVVIYFGFNGSNNKVSKKFEIEKADTLLWGEAFAETLWSTNKSKKITFANFEKENHTAKMYNNTTSTGLETDITYEDPWGNPIN